MRDEAGCRWTVQWKGHFSFSGELGGEPVTIEPAPNWPYPVTNEILVFQRQQNKTTSCAARTCIEKKILTSNDTWNQFLHPWAKDWYLTRAWPPKPLQKQGVCCPGRSGAEDPWPHLTIKGQGPEPLHGNPPFLHFCWPTLLPLLLKAWSNPRSER